MSYLKNFYKNREIYEERQIACNYFVPFKQRKSNFERVK